MPRKSETAGRPKRSKASFVVVANRLPVDRSIGPDGREEWRTSPGGLVAALEPVLAQNSGTWVGWTGAPDDKQPPFEADDLRMVPVTLSADEVADYYEGFSNATLWPLYHDVTAPPVFERRWWDAYREVNRRFAAVAAEEAATGAIVWVQDYQLQLVPALLRAERPDLRIGFFNHIPFPGYELYSRLPWRTQVVEGLLGADLIGFQRRDDASNFLRAARVLTGATTRGSVIEVAPKDGAPGRHLRAAPFPISIDTAGLEALSRRPDVVGRANELRSELGNPSTVLLGVDRLDYTKGILHRLRAYGELLDDGELGPPGTVLIQVASPSRERVGEYQNLRDEVELIVGRVNGDHSSVGNPAIHYLHQSFPKEEMAALYLLADVMLVTPLRDGMNLVAKEYVACHHDLHGALVLSEFTGAADELRQAFLVNPYDIDGMKDAILAAVRATPVEQSRRMRPLRRRVIEADVHHWANTFLGALDMVTTS
ncbi:trehalose-6-phosphate synthase [Acidiferrimicrobium sp. IK]|uniref:alpha,alpha-trehalose-phosphate synthase (UDP-forming) n=1 Tax=Acidiferrimicrobium sp. IK TaxID=2871700 RepID=UPI0021CB7E0F|nr:trehalose-6-phosphate synthase [Acidiferrimicrobium sp. IK]MCU4185118.1 trehalose-6-phosphate synthase [Acidiferrimicrobium sp. IK]